MKRISLKINARKTELLRTPEAYARQLSLTGQHAKDCESFKYLGSIIQKNVALDYLLYINK